MYISQHFSSSLLLVATAQWKYYSFQDIKFNTKSFKEKRIKKLMIFESIYSYFDDDVSRIANELTFSLLFSISIKVD
jgi:hypothetical protein